MASFVGDGVLASAQSKPTPAFYSLTAENAEGDIVTENLTKAKEIYQDISVVLSSQRAEVDKKEVLRLAFELYLLCEHGEKVCIENGKIKQKPEEQIGAIIDRAFEKLTQNEEKRHQLAKEHSQHRARTVGVFSRVEGGES